MEKIRVLMIDDNTNLVEMVKEYFTGHKKIPKSKLDDLGNQNRMLILKKQRNYWIKHAIRQ